VEKDFVEELGERNLAIRNPDFQNDTFHADEIKQSLILFGKLISSAPQAQNLHGMTLLRVILSYQNFLIPHIDGKLVTFPAPFKEVESRVLPVCTDLDSFNLMFQHGKLEERKFDMERRFSGSELVQMANVVAENDPKIAKSIAFNWGQNGQLLLDERGLELLNYGLHNQFSVISTFFFMY
jgi:hypothetical protein